MSKKEGLIFEMENLISILHEYLEVLYRGEEIDGVAYNRINESIYSALYALQDYFNEEPAKQRREIMIERIEDLSRFE